MGSTKRNNKRGSYIMEASLVLPVLIFAVITVVLIIMFFYSQMTQRSQMHIARRQEAGRQTETMISEHVLERDGRSNGNREEILADGAQRNLDKEGRFCCQGELQRCGCSSICAVLQPCQGDKK